LNFFCMLYLHVYKEIWAKGKGVKSYIPTD